jgi:hypothetical protein
MQTTAPISAAKKMAGNNSMAANRCNVMIAPAPVDHNRMFCADRSFCWQCVQPRWSELGSQIAHSLGVELGTLPDHRGDIGLIGLRAGGRGATTPPAGDGARTI